MKKETVLKAILSTNGNLSADTINNLSADTINKIKKIWDNVPTLELPYITLLNDIKEKKRDLTNDIINIIL